MKGDVSALEGATFTLTDGVIMGLTGESGCGKTTLGKSLILQILPMKYVEGSVKLDGETLPIWDTENMNPFRFKKVSIHPEICYECLEPDPENR